MDLKKELGSVAEAVKKVMEAELSSKQKAIAKMSEPKHKIDAGDLAKLRAGHKPVKEEIKQIDELSKATLKSYLKKNKERYWSGSQEGPASQLTDKARELGRDGEHITQSREYGEKAARRKLNLGYQNEDVEQIDEMGYSAKAARAGKDIGKPGKMFGKIAASAAKKYGSEERGKKVAGAVLAKLRMKEDEDFDITDEQAEQLLEAYEYDEENKLSFSEMLSIYKENGLSAIVEEPTEAEFNAEIKDQMDSFLGKKKQPKVAAPATKGVKDMPESVEVEQIKENAMHGTVYLHKYHEGSSEKEYGEAGKGHTQHAHYVYHKAPGGKPKLLGDVEHNVNDKTKKTAHAVARTKDMEQDHKSQGDAIQHLMDLHGVHPSTPIRHITDKKQMNEALEERSLTEPEMKKKEEIVKSMKKKMPGFKERYGERAKSVMYATATKIAKKD